MIRNRRGDTGIEWTKRHVKTVLIDFNEAERDLYNSIDLLRGDMMTGPIQVPSPF